ncbi:MAG: hypothetical protein JSW39_12170 [Desulfobacterales bacterium]|nr:MAG: hypothetical protein JSW39_12170 [Desulfobacterales bacterium]
MPDWKKKIVDTSAAPAAIGTYSQGVGFNGTYYFSGQIGINPQTNELPNGFQPQLNQILANIDALLQSCGLSRNDIIKTTVYLTDLGDFPAVNAAYESYFTAPYPARVCIEVSGLPKAALVEIEVIAAQPQS